MRKTAILAALGLCLAGCGITSEGAGASHVEGHVYYFEYLQTHPGPGSYPATNVMIRFERQDGFKLFGTEVTEVKPDSSGAYLVSLAAGTYLVKAEVPKGGAAVDWDVGLRNLLWRPSAHLSANFGFSQKPQ